MYGAIGFHLKCCLQHCAMLCSVWGCQASSLGAVGLLCEERPGLPHCRPWLGPAAMEERLAEHLGKKGQNAAWLQREILNLCLCLHHKLSSSCSSHFLPSVCWAGERVSGRMGDLDKANPTWRRWSPVLYKFKNTPGMEESRWNKWTMFGRKQICEKYNQWKVYITHLKRMTFNPQTWKSLLEIVGKTTNNQQEQQN